MAKVSYLRKEQQLRCKEQSEDGDDLVIASVPRRSQFSEDEAGQQGEKGAGDCHGGEETDRVRAGDGEAAGEPEAEQQGKRPAGKGLSPGPVGDGGQEKAGDDSRDETEEQFMLVPDDGREGARKGDPAEEPGHPKRDHQRRMQRA